MMKLIKKCKPGGWINKNKHIWDYSDSPYPDIQKKQLHITQTGALLSRTRRYEII